MNKKNDTPLEEQETVLNYSKYQLGDWCELYTTDKLVMRRYAKFASEHPEHCKVMKEDAFSMTFSIDPRVALYPRAPVKRVLTEEQKQELRERLAKSRNK